jgi:lipid A 3-O-deacylase
MGWSLCVACLLAAFVADPRAQAQETDRWRFRQFQVENDFLPVPYTQPGDRFYTNGIRVSLGKGVFAPGADASGFPVWLRPVRRWCPNCLIFPNFSFGQQMYTPEDIENPGPQPGERPWAAWLYAGFGAAIDPSDVTRHDVEVQVGITGEAAGGEAAQKFWHRLTNSPEPRGWDNQLGPDLGVNGYYDFQHILISADDDAVIDWDFVPSVKADVGSLEPEDAQLSRLRSGNGWRSRGQDLSIRVPQPAGF